MNHESCFHEASGRMKPRRCLLVGATLATVLLMVLAYGLGMMGIGDRFAFDQIIKRLEAGAIVLGSETKSIIGMGKPRTEVSNFTADRSRRFGTSAFYHEGEFLILYWVDHEFFGAHFIGLGHERWFFCDLDLFKDYIAVVGTETTEEHTLPENDR